MQVLQKLLLLLFVFIAPAAVLAADHQGHEFKLADGGLEAQEEIKPLAIIVSGMPASGKSTVGEKLAVLLGSKFINGSNLLGDDNDDEENSRLLGMLKSGNGVVLSTSLDRLFVDKNKIVRSRDFLEDLKKTHEVLLVITPTRSIEDIKNAVAAKSNQLNSPWYIRADHPKRAHIVGVNQEKVEAKIQEFNSLIDSAPSHFGNNILRIANGDFHNVEATVGQELRVIFERHQGAPALVPVYFGTTCEVILSKTNAHKVKKLTGHLNTKNESGVPAGRGQVYPVYISERDFGGKIAKEKPVFYWLDSVDNQAPTFMSYPKLQGAYYFDKQGLFLDAAIAVGLTRQPNNEGSVEFNFRYFGQAKKYFWHVGDALEVEIDAHQAPYPTIFKRPAAKAKVRAVAKSDFNDRLVQSNKDKMDALRNRALAAVGPRQFTENDRNVSKWQAREKMSSDLTKQLKLAYLNLVGLSSADFNNGQAQFDKFVEEMTVAVTVLENKHGPKLEFDRAAIFGMGSDSDHTYKKYPALCEKYYRGGGMVFRITGKGKNKIVAVKPEGRILGLRKFFGDDDSTVEAEEGEEKAPEGRSDIEVSEKLDGAAGGFIIIGDLLVIRSKNSPVFVAMSDDANEWIPKALFFLASDYEQIIQRSNYVPSSEIALSLLLTIHEMAPNLRNSFLKSLKHRETVVELVDGRHFIYSPVIKIVVTQGTEVNQETKMPMARKIRDVYAEAASFGLEVPTMDSFQNATFPEVANLVAARAETEGVVAIVNDQMYKMKTHWYNSLKFGIMNVVTDEFARGKTNFSSKVLDQMYENKCRANGVPDDYIDQHRSAAVAFLDKIKDLIKDKKFDFENMKGYAGKAGFAETWRTFWQMHSAGEI